MIQKIKKISLLLIISLFLLLRTNLVQAFDAPSAPQTPTLSVESNTPTAAPAAPPAPSAPESPSSPVEEQKVSEAPKQTDTENASNTSGKESTQNQEESSQPEQTSTTGQTPNTGSNQIKTGDTTNSGIITNNLNNNITSDGTTENGSSKMLAANLNNGADSENSTSINTQNNTTTVQENNGNVENNLELKTQTGQNSSSYNVGDSSIETGDANTTGTSITTLNTNADVIVVSEFNIVDNQLGDLVLDFAKNCISGCSNLNSQNTGNGARSQNNIGTIQLSNEATFQNNDANIGSTLTLSSDTGANQSTFNTGGDSKIQTGDANTSGNVLTFANNNIAGNVLYGVVNIFGNLIGDIILPESETNCINCTNNTLSNTSNGASSENNLALTQTSNETTFQTNNADIDNNFVLTAATGDNQTSLNTGGDSKISTGDSNVQAQTINVANSNIEGESMWLVIVNKAGQWVGQLLGAPAGSDFAGSEGTEFIVGENGEIIATNSNNGANSQNNISSNQNQNSTTVQNNQAKITNNINLTSNTGNNEANYNTGGNSTIKTGDAKVIANLVNFVNNNISGKGKLVVTVVNVFGSWIGDFVTPASPASGPGSKKQVAQKPQENNNQGNPEELSNSIPEDNLEGEDLSSTDTQEENKISQTSATNIGAQAQIKPSNAVQVAGVKIESNGFKSWQNNIISKKAGDLKKKVSINLAWLLLLAPLAPLAYIAKRR